MNKFLLIALSILLVLSACQSQATASAVETEKTVNVGGGSYIKITPAKLKSMLDRKDFVFVNVHIPFAGNIAATDVSFPYDEIEQYLSKLPSDKNAKIVLYCRSGRMSTIAAEALVKMGYTNLLELDGGMVAWEQAGYEVQK